MSAIDWSKLEHAYGPASDIPALLKALKGKDMLASLKALGELEEKLYHDGWRYDGTLVAVPALLEVLKISEYPHRQRVLSFLGDIAVQCPDEVVVSGSSPQRLMQPPAGRS